MGSVDEQQLAEALNGFDRGVACFGGGGVAFAVAALLLELRLGSGASSLPVFADFFFLIAYLCAGKGEETEGRDSEKEREGNSGGHE